MNHNLEESLRYAQLAFLGRLLSAFTHELKNHLAIINESSGLMGDLIELGRIKDEETSVKFQKIISSIAERIDLANSLSKNLNSFGHRMDKTVTEFSVNDVLREELVLMNKFARLKAIDIAMDMQDDIPAVRSNPALLQFLVYSFLTAFFVHAQRGDAIRIKTRRKNGNVTIQVETQTQKNNSEAAVPEHDPSDSALMGYVCEKLQIDFQEEVRNTERTCLLTLPCA